MSRDIPDAIKKINPSYIFSFVLLALIIAGRWGGIEAAENLASAGITIIFVLTVITVFTDEKEWFKLRPPKMDKKLHALYFLIAATLFAGGWFWLGAFYSASAILVIGMKVRKIQSMEATKGET